MFKISKSRDNLFSNGHIWTNGFTHTHTHTHTHMEEYSLVAMVSYS